MTSLIKSFAILLLTYCIILNLATGTKTLETNPALHEHMMNIYMSVHMLLS